MGLLKINGKEQEFADNKMPATVADLLRQLGVDSTTVVAELQGQIIERKNFSTTPLHAGQTYRTRQIRPGGLNRGQKTDDRRQGLVIAGKNSHSSLLIGTGKFSSSKAMAQAIEAAGAQIVTVALRRVDITNKDDDMLSAIDREKYLLLPNTSGARTADEAIRLSRLARAATGINWVKLEVTPDPYYLVARPD